MEFRTPCNHQFSIPDDWWAFADMLVFTAESHYYPYAPLDNENVEVVEISQVEPPARSLGIVPFKKYKLLPVLFAFQSPECALPPVAVSRLNSTAHQFRVRNGFHRYFASVAVGYKFLPVVVFESLDEQEL